jgi:hypothetical protein
MSTPVKLVKEIGNVFVGAAAAIVKSKKKWMSTSLSKVTDGCGRGSSGGRYGSDVLFEIRDIEFIERCISTGKTTSLKMTRQNDVMIKKRYGPHFPFSVF